MIYAFDENKNKVEVLKIINQAFVASGDTQRITINYPSGFSYSNSALLSVEIKSGNNLSFSYEDSTYLNGVLQGEGAIIINLKNLTPNTTYGVKITLARTS